MLNSRFGLKQASNVISASGETHNTGSQNSQNISELYVIAKYDYQSQGPQELSIRKGDRLLLIDDSRHWWKVLDGSNQTGFVPSNYVKREKQSLFDSIRRGIRVNTKAKKPSFTNSSQSSPSPITSRGRIASSQDSNFAPDRNGRDSITTAKNSTNTPPSHSDILVRELGPNFNVQTNHDGLKDDSFMSIQQTDLRCPPLNESINKIIATVKYNYKSQQPDELSLVKGSTITVLEKSDDGWWKGEIGSQIGWFPSNYVLEQLSVEDGSKNINKQLNTPLKSLQSNGQRDLTSAILNSQGRPVDVRSSSNEMNINNGDQSFEPQLSSQEQDHHVLFVVVALYSFQSQNNEELSFSKDERLDIIEKPINDPDWWRACNQLGETGLVPKNYVQILPSVQSIRNWSPKSPNKKFPGRDVTTATIGNASNDPSLPLSSSTTITNDSQRGNNNNLNDGINRMKTTPIDSIENVSILTRQSSNFFEGNHIVDGVQAITSNCANGANSAMNQSSLAQLAHELEVKLKLNDKIWYHGVMSRQQCDQLLNAYADDGDFLIRNSETNAGDFSVSLKAPVRNKHFRVHYMDDSFCIGQRKFDSLDELVEHYKRTPIYTSASGEKMFLKKPYAL